MKQSIQENQSNAKDNERSNQCTRQWKGTEIEDISVYFTCLCYQLECLFTRDINSMHPSVDFHSFIRWSSWSNSHLNNIRSDKTEGQTHRHRVTDTKHFHFKYNQITTRHFTANANDETSLLFSMKCYMVQIHNRDTIYTEKVEPAES